MHPRDLSRRLKEQAIALGFDRAGIAPAVRPPDYDRFRDWLDSGFDAGMTYLRKHADARAHPDSVLEGVRSVLMVSLVYGEGPSGPPRPTSGKIARYARGDDYHHVVRARLEALIEWLRAEAPGVSARAVVDTAPLLERDFARLAGLGWIGKNTLLIDRKLGSFTFLGALLVDVDLEPDAPHETSHCGTCTRCLDACPTDAFDGPHRLDARKCISYWTIEHVGPIPEPAGSNLDGWVFGCDVCQDVCPWNRKAPPGLIPELAPRPEWDAPDLLEWLGRSKGDWKRALRGSAMQRTRRNGLLRNAAMAMGVEGRLDAVPALAGRLADRGEDSAVRAAAAWALGRLATPEARAALDAHRHDDDPAVREAVAGAG
ncbi:tRNA epoxyqueuosine(34) reductase QueG [Planctomyces sp. SH-PL62]|uniref:tRNA epoxyqueuosine(34) reductase QueG n=1 Tax=Planctomyces sp. SH-PL62 TaxID=1636152 RepID=UPI00078E6BD8|nr:tRNA epoxyqueuosine(34) reductase QueG [Planctomyces sp. SH-PL62]AMV37419.1 Epoxyqueuosine reductase [Planctomyces sp. SH-PL62]